MMKWICYSLLFLFVQAGFGQEPNQPQQPPYKKFPTIPPIALMQVDSSTLTKDDLKKNHPTLIMYFSPSCEHCIHQMEEMMKQKEDLKKFQVVMATYQPFEEMVDFYKKYGLDKLPNFRIGRDTKFSLPPFYVMKSLPYFALYDKKGQLITTFEGNVKVDALVKAFAKKG